MRRTPAAGPWVVACLVLAGVLNTASCTPAPPARRPDVVLVTIDTLRPDFLGFLGFEHDSAPFMARLAESCVVLEEAVSTSSWTAPSTASIFSGVYPNRHQVLAGLVAQAHADQAASQTIAMQPIRSGLPTLPELFAAAGYRTFGLASNPSIRAELGFERGFGQFECRPAASAAELIDTLISWQPEAERDSPYFVYLHLNDVHAPYAARDPWYEKVRDARADQRQRYLSEVSYIDSELARAFEHFGWERDAIVMLVSDHGEEFLEHRGIGHGFSLHAELNRVLFLFRSPRPGFEAARVTARGSLIDALPTLVELAGIPVPESIDGRSLVALGDHVGRAALQAELDGRTLLAHRRDMRNDAHLWAAMRGHWKLILGEDSRSTHLYDLSQDPGEHDDTLALDGEPARALQNEVRLYRERAAAQAEVESSEVELSAELLEQLRELGYVTGN